MNTSPNDEIVVHVLFFGGARDATSSSEIDLSIPASATVKVAFDNLVSRFPDLAKYGRSLLFAVNQEYADRNSKLKTGDELAIFPPVSGG